MGKGERWEGRVSVGKGGKAVGWGGVRLCWAKGSVFFAGIFRDEGCFFRDFFRRV